MSTPLSSLLSTPALLLLIWLIKDERRGKSERTERRTSILLNEKRENMAKQHGCKEEGGRVVGNLKRNLLLGNNLLAKAIITTTINVELLFLHKMRRQREMSFQRQSRDN